MKTLTKKKGGIVGDLVSGTGGLVITVVVIFVVIATLLGAGLLTTGSIYANTSDNLAGNLTTGVNSVASKIPTILLVAAVVLLFGAIVLLVQRANAMGIGAKGGSL